MFYRLIWMITLFKFSVILYYIFSLSLSTVFKSPAIIGISFFLFEHLSHFLLIYLENLLFGIYALKMSYILLKHYLSY